MIFHYIQRKYYCGYISNDPLPITTTTISSQLESTYICVMMTDLFACSGHNNGCNVCALRVRTFVLTHVVWFIYLC